MNSLSRMLKVLDLFKPEQPVIEVEHICTQLGYTSASAYRYLRELLDAGLLVRLPRGYALGPRVIELDRQMTEFDPLLSASRQPVAELATLTGLSVLISELYGATVINVLHQPGADPDLLNFGRGQLVDDAALVVGIVLSVPGIALTVELTGGLPNQFVHVYYVPVVAGALFLPRRWGIAVTLFALLCVSPAIDPIHAALHLKPFYKDPSPFNLSGSGRIVRWSSAVAGRARWRSGRRGPMRYETACGETQADCPPNRR